MRLWNDSLRSLYGPRQPRGRRVSSYSHKRRIDAAAAGLTFWPDVTPLVRLYVLDRRHPGRRPRVEPLSAREGLVALLRFTFHLDVEDRHAVRARFDRAARIAGTVPIRRLVLPGDLAQLDTLPPAIEADLSA